MTQDLGSLNKPFPDEIIEEKNGFSYVPAPYVIERLNECLNPFGWDFAVTETIYHEPTDTVLCHGRLTIFSTTEGERSFMASKEQWGGQKVNRSRDQVIDLSNDYKGAASDALKKCASLLGVAEQLYMKPNKRAQAKTQAKPPAKTGEWDGESNPANDLLFALASAKGINLMATLAAKGQKLKDLPEIERIALGRWLQQAGGKSA